MIIKDETRTLLVANGNILSVSAKNESAYFKLHDGSSFEVKYMASGYNGEALQKLFILAIYHLESIEMDSWVTQYLTYLSKQEGSFQAFADTDYRIKDGKVKGVFFGCDVDCSVDKLVEEFSKALSVGA